MAGDQSEKRISHTFKNISRLAEEDSMKSPVTMLQTLPWRLMALMKNKTGQHGCRSLGLYVVCDADLPSADWSCYASATMTLHSSKNDLKRDIEHKFCEDEIDWGFSQFVTWSKLIDPDQGYVHDDQIEVTVDLVANPPIIRDQAVDELVRKDKNYPSDALSGMCKLWKDKTLLDVTISSGTKSIGAHKLVLASVSDYFKNLFKYDIKEKYTLDGDTVSENSLEPIVQYAYTGKISINVENAQELFIAASFLQIDFITDESENFIARNVNTDNVLNLICLLTHYECPILARSIFITISENFHLLERNEEFLELSTTELKYLIKSKQLTVLRREIPVDNPEKDILRFVGKFFTGRNIETASVVDILDGIRFSELENNDLQEVLECFPVLKCSKTQEHIEDSRQRSKELLKPRLGARSLKTFKVLPTKCRRNSDEIVIESFDDSTKVDIHDKICQIELWTQNLTDVPGIVGFSITYASGKTLVHGVKPMIDAIDTFEHTICLDEYEVITKLKLRYDKLLSSIQFETNFDKEYGPFGEIHGTRLPPYTSPESRYSYLHSFKGQVVENGGDCGIVELSSVWVTFPSHMD